MIIKLKSHSGEKKKIFAFSDTHGNHRQVVIPKNIETIVFAGDACDCGDERQLADFFDWFSSLPAKNKLFVPGNHDLPFPLCLEPEILKKMAPENVIYMDEGKIILEDIHFYVLPVRPWMDGVSWLPAGMDVLITHGAPSGILDETPFGCPILRELVEEAKPKIHIFGHIHSKGGQSVRMNKTKFYNVSVCK
ncbi:MAG: metallophosphoesterase [Candidatus Symbiothrix sp.]|jgi:Icc-related predicted phosphoesterase|nr:metallophosphoesterase [Candidatus Symbiothrix sp.]